MNKALVAGLLFLLTFSVTYACISIVLQKPMGDPINDPRPRLLGDPINDPRPRLLGDPINDPRPQLI
jgi:hypothetical protein